VRRWAVACWLSIITALVLAGVIGWGYIMWWALRKTRAYLWDLHRALRHHCPEDYEHTPAYDDN
jgi:hypothetical protein